MNCGGQVGPAPAAPAAATQQPEIISAVAQSGERRVVTVMFADISGFTAMSERMDPEQVRSLMNKCFDRLVPIITKYEGVVDKFIGDAIMALFGAPVAHEDDLVARTPIFRPGKMQLTNYLNNLEVSGLIRLA
jgi:class 3 adenylate cyclase